jgi:hypothetical protein
VTAVTSLITTENATVGTAIENRRIVELPLNGRNYLSLIALSPNVSAGFAGAGQAGDRAGLKPCNSALTRYAPGGIAGKAKAPTSLLCWVRVALVATFCAVTVAPGIVAPEESFTSPVMVPSV